VFCCEVPQEEKVHKSTEAVGIDLGLDSFAALSNGEKIIKPKHLMLAEKMMKRKQRQLSRKKKGSRNRRKARFQLARLHAKVAFQREDWLHKESTKLAKGYSFIAVEKLRISNMLRNHTLAKAIGDAGWGMFLRMLPYKAVTAGGQVAEVDARDTSNRCSDCGHKQEMPLSKRVFECEVCGLVLDRDMNAAQNILKKATAGQAGSHAWGQGVRPLEQSIALAAVLDEPGTICGGAS